MDSEVDVIQHLLEVEKEASFMLKDAQKTADQIISKAKASADESFKTEYSKIVNQIEEHEKQEKSNLMQKHSEQFSEYRASLESLKKDNNAFVSCFEKLLQD